MSRANQLSNEFYSRNDDKGYPNYEAAFEMMRELAEELENELNFEKDCHLETIFAKNAMYNKFKNRLKDAGLLGFEDFY